MRSTGATTLAFAQHELLEELRGRLLAARALLVEDVLDVLALSV